VATLKRKCREWKLQWPKTEKQRLLSKTLVKMNVSFITYDEDALSEKYMDSQTVLQLQQAFAMK